MNQKQSIIYYTTIFLAPFFFFLLFMSYFLLWSESVQSLVAWVKMQSWQQKSREDLCFFYWPDVSRKVISQTAIRMVVFNRLKFQKELPEGNKEEEGKSQQQTKCRFCRIGRPCSRLWQRVGGKKLSGPLSAVGSGQGQVTFWVKCDNSNKDLRSFYSWK